VETRIRNNWLVPIPILGVKMNKLTIKIFLKKIKYAAYSLMVIGLILGLIGYSLFGYPDTSYWLLIILPLAILLLAVIVEVAGVASGLVLSFVSLLLFGGRGSDFDRNFCYFMICISFLFLSVALFYS
jgi:hypothetical protein